MRVWEAASLVFFVYVAAVAVRPSQHRPRGLSRLLLGAAAGSCFVLLVARLPHVPIVHDWLAPPVALLVAYWTSGLLFVCARPRQERALLDLDRKLRVVETARRIPSALAALLEASYAAVYPIIPVALLLHLWLVPGGSAERFWSVILITDYVCFAALAWVQTRPPRGLEGEDRRTSRLRRFNLQMLGATSIQVNTFPSGHAAEALAAALLVIGAPLPIVVVMFLMAIGISAGAVFGRYHYAADALAGWGVALVVWALSN